MTNAPKHSYSYSSLQLDRGYFAFNKDALVSINICVL